MAIIRKAAPDTFYELYDGQMALANRKLVADNVPPLKISARGRGLYALSESYYGKWLEEGNDPSLVDKAIALCRESVALGYPHAVVRMAYYYDKDYVAVDRTEEFRCRVACDYYSKVVYQDAAPPSEDGTLADIGWQELRRLAAGMLLDMLSCAPDNLAGKYSYEYHAERIGGILDVSCEKSARRRTEHSGTKIAEAVFKACKINKIRAPLFGLMQLNLSEAKEIFAPKSPTMKLSGDVNIWIRVGDKITKAGNTTAFADFMSKLQASEVWVYYFNNNLGGHKYLNGKQRRGLCELMMQDKFMRFGRLAASAEERERREYLFSDDDVAFFLTGILTPLKTALDGLIDRVINENDWSDL